MFRILVFVKVERDYCSVMQDICSVLLKKKVAALAKEHKTKLVSSPNVTHVT